jgi:hypothetical protein
MDAYESGIIYDPILAAFGDATLGAEPPEYLTEAQKVAWGAQKTRTLRDAGLFIAWADEEGLFVEGVIPSREDPRIRDEAAIERSMETLRTGVVRKRNSKAPQT